MNFVITKKRIPVSSFIPCLSCIIVLLFLRDYVGMEIPASLFLVLVLLIAFFASKTEMISFCVCCIPMLNAFQTKYALIICMVMYFIRFVRSLKIKKAVFPIILLFIWEIVHGLVTTFAPVQIIRLFTELIFCTFVMSVSSDDIDFNSMSRLLAFTTICICTIILLSQLKSVGYNVNLLFSGIFRFGAWTEEDVMSVGFNPNILSLICLSSIECLSIIIYKSEAKLYDYIGISALVVFGLLTMSKKFIIAGMIFLFLFLFCQKHFMKKIKYFIIIFVLSIIVFFVLSKAFPSVFDMIVSRFNEGDITTGRTNILAYYNEKLFSDIKLLWFGVGYYDYAVKLSILFHDASIPHNAIQELLVMWGIPGLLFFVIFVINMVKEAKRENQKVQMINYIPFIILLIFCQAAQMVSSTVTVMLLAVTYICMCENTKVR